MPGALLVMAFHEPEVLRSAIPIYKAAGTDVYVHLDAKADIHEYIARLGDAASGCRLIDRRYKIFWGGFSMVEAELALIFAAVEGGNYDTFNLVSDDSYPIVSPQRLCKLTQGTHDLIMLRKLDADDPFMLRYSRFFFLDHQASSLLGRPIESAYIDDEFLDHVARLQNLRATGKKDIDIYYGSQWWSITRDSMHVILDHLETDSHLLDSFRYSAVPDEILFQTLVGNLIPRTKVRGGPVFVDWGRAPKPYIFTNSTELLQISPDYAFARKFSGRMSGAYEVLRERLDSQTN